MPLIEATHHALFEQHADRALGFLHLANVIHPIRQALRCARVLEAVDDCFSFALQPLWLASDLRPTLERSRQASEHPLLQHSICLMLKDLFRWCGFFPRIKCTYHMYVGHFEKNSLGFCFQELLFHCELSPSTKCFQLSSLNKMQHQPSHFCVPRPTKLGFKTPKTQRMPWYSNPGALQKILHKFELQEAFVLCILGPLWKACTLQVEVVSGLHAGAHGLANFRIQEANTFEGMKIAAKRNKCWNQRSSINSHLWRSEKRIIQAFVLPSNISHKREQAANRRQRIHICPCL